MKPEKEFRLLVKLYHSPPKKGNLFRKKVAWSKREFESYLGFSEKNKDFKEWFNTLADRGCLVNGGQEKRGNGFLVEVFTVDTRMLEQLIRENECYGDIWGMFADKTFLGLPLDK